MREGVTLFDLLEILSRRKKLLGIIFCLAIFIGVGYLVYSLYFLPQIFEAKVMVMTNPIIYIPPPSSNFYESLQSAILRGPGLTKEFYLSRIMSPAVIEKIIKMIPLPASQYTSGNLKEKMKAEYLDNTDSIELSIQDTDPNMASEMVNAWASIFTEDVQGTIQKWLGKSLEKAFLRMETNKNDLEKLRGEMDLLMKKIPYVDGMKKEISEQIKILYNYQKDLLDLGLQSKTLETQIEKIKSNLEKEKQFLEIGKSIQEDQYITGDMVYGGRVRVPGVKVKREEINPNYCVLSNKLYDLEVTLSGVRARRDEMNGSKLIQRLTTDISEKEVLMTTVQFQKTDIENRYEVACNNYNISYQQWKEANEVFSNRVGEEIVTIMSRALPPEKSLAARFNIKFVLAISIFMGLLFSIFLVFFAEFWKKMKEYQKEHHE